ncbi:YncE family protein [Kribbella pratensis]|uniref:YVTN family beta-propeller protein n=1 Tax=Kribbella pratensis TaxID=2512112 RepID=A0A4R8CPI5_9ACTN|nr:hypothetical protein [Kribbella pratensis]TDW78044.1 YVTN family beta-propeller protein [Kribbella pratensis]
MNTGTMQTVGGPLASGPNPADIAVDEKGARLYVAGGDSDTVAVIDTKTRQPARSPITVKSKLRDLTPGPDGALYAIGSTSYAVINTKAETTRPTPVDVPAGSRIAASDGKKLFILGGDDNQGTAGTDDVVRIVDLGKHQVVGSLTDDLGVAVELVVSPDGQRMYVSNFYQDGILVLDTVGPKVIGKIELKS